MHRFVSRGVPAIAALLLFSACGDGGNDPAGLPVCTRLVTVTVSSDPEPVFSWEPACRTSGLGVAQVTTGATNWQLYSRENLIAPGIRYGHVPAGVTVVHAAAPLGRDTSYGVGIYETDGAPRGDFGSFTTPFGGTNFTTCETLQDGTCRTTPERFAARTVEGVDVEAVPATASIARGDTAWIELRVINRGDDAATVQQLSDCWTRRSDIVDGAGRSAFGIRLLGCDDPRDPIVLGSHEYIGARIPFTGVVSSGGTKRCLAPGTWTLVHVVNAANGGKRVGATATVTLTERASARQGCTS